MKITTKLDELGQAVKDLKSIFDQLPECDNKKYLALLLQNAKYAIQELNHEKIMKALEAILTIEVTE